MFRLINVVIGEYLPLSNEGLILKQKKNWKFCGNCRVQNCHCVRCASAKWVGFDSVEIKKGHFSWARAVISAVVSEP